MTWEQRLREMVLAGGALALGACSSGSSGGAATPDAGSVQDSGEADQQVGECCNANPDPCCPHQYCGAPMTSACAQEQACEAEGGTWNDSNPGACLYDAGESDAGAKDGASSDATATDAAPSDAAPSDAAPSDTGVDTDAHD